MESINSAHIFNLVHALNIFPVGSYFAKQEKNIMGPGKVLLGRSNFQSVSLGLFISYKTIVIKSHLTWHSHFSMICDYFLHRHSFQILGPDQRSYCSERFSAET